MLDVVDRGLGRAGLCDCDDFLDDAVSGLNGVTIRALETSGIELSSTPSDISCNRSS